MSAYIVSDAHIDALLTFAIAANASYYVTAAETRVSITRQNATEIGQLLLDENVRSVGHRYGGRIDTEEKNAAAAYSFRPFDLSHPNRAVIILKACSCFDYQACETDDYSKSVAHEIIDSIRHAAIRALPGYDGGPGWSLERPVAVAATRDPDVGFGPVFARLDRKVVPITKLSPGQKAAATRRARRNGAT